MKKSIIFFVLVLCVMPSMADVGTDLKLAAWNIRILSNGSRDNVELNKIADIIVNYEFVAIIELRDETVMERLNTILKARGKNYSYIVSPRVGAANSRHKERYAFLYQEGISLVTPGKLYPDTDDGVEDFVRDPWFATFKAGNFDFTIITHHVTWGRYVGPRKAEVKALAKVYEYVQKDNGDEQDVILVGDFNRNASDSASYGPLLEIPNMTQLFKAPLKSHIRDSSLYDNIFFQLNHTHEYYGRSGIDRFDEDDFNNDDRAASLAVSDHRPVWARFSTIEDDDGPTKQKRLIYTAEEAKALKAQIAARKRANN